MSLFKNTDTNEQTRKRGRAANGEPASSAGGSSGTDIDKRLTEVEELAKSIGQLTVIHDVRLRELATLFRVMMVPQTSGFFKRCDTVDEKWKETMQSYHKRRKETGQTEELGSKHLKLAQGMFEEMYAHASIKPQIKQFLAGHWKDADQDTEDFLAKDVKTMKWRQTKDAKHGIMEFKLADESLEVETELVRLMEEDGGTVKTGTAARGQRVRDLQDKLEGTWGRK